MYKVREPKKNKSFKLKESTYNKFRKQSEDMDMSMSKRIQEFMEKELLKGVK